MREKTIGELCNHAISYGHHNIVPFFVENKNHNYTQANVRNKLRGGMMQSNAWVQGWVAEVAWGFCYDLNELRGFGKRTKPNARVEYFDIFTHITNFKAGWFYSLGYLKCFGLKQEIIVKAV